MIRLQITNSPMTRVRIQRTRTPHHISLNRSHRNPRTTQQRPKVRRNMSHQRTNQHTINSHSHSRHTITPRLRRTHLTPQKLSRTHRISQLNVIRTTPKVTHFRMAPMRHRNLHISTQHNVSSIRITVTHRTPALTTVKPRNHSQSTHHSTNPTTVTNQPMSILTNTTRTHTRHITRSRTRVTNIQISSRILHRPPNRVTTTVQRNTRRTSQLNTRHHRPAVPEYFEGIVTPATVRAAAEAVHAQLTTLPPYIIQPANRVNTTTSSEGLRHTPIIHIRSVYAPSSHDDYHTHK